MMKRVTFTVARFFLLKNGDFRILRAQVSIFTVYGIDELMKNVTFATFYTTYG